MFGWWKQHAFAYKFVFMSIGMLFLGLALHWLTTLGLFGHFMSDRNLHDEFGDVCSYTTGPESFAGIEDLTLVNQHVLYFAHPYRKTFANKALVSQLARYLGLDGSKINDASELFPLLPAEYRAPKIFTTDLSATTSSSFPAPLPIEEVPIEGFDLEKYYEFYPLGADSWTDPNTKQHFINVVFVNRLGSHVAQFELIETAKSIGGDGQAEVSNQVNNNNNNNQNKSGGGDDHHSPNLPPPAPKSTTIKLRLINIFSNDIWTSLNAVAMINQHEFYVTNFLTKDPIRDEFGALMELVLLRRLGSVLHCSSKPEAQYWDPVAYEMRSGGVAPLESHPKYRSYPTPFPLPTPQSSSELHCYQFVSGLGQTNGIAVDHTHGQVIVTGGLNKQIIVFELGTHAYLQQIKVQFGVDNLKIDPDTHDLYYGVNPSMVAVGGLMNDFGTGDATTKAYSPNAIFRLKSQSVEYSTRDLARKHARRQLARDGIEEDPNLDIDEMEVDVSVPVESDNGADTNHKSNNDSANPQYDHLNSKNTKSTKEQPKTKKREFVNKRMKISEIEDKTEFFHYYNPDSIPVYIDTKPFNKQTAPSGLPIPLLYTKGKVQGLPDFKWVISGSIYDQGIEVCRVIE